MISRVGPQQFVQGADAFEYLPKFVKNNGYDRVLFLHGVKSLNAAKPYLKGNMPDAHIKDVYFGGECSPEEIERVANIAKEDGTQLIIGLGGGKVLDTAKSVNHQLKLADILIPTLASNCAPWSTLSVHYKPNHEHINHYIYDHGTDLMLMNPKVIMNSPIDYFVAGIGDTLAKFYESELMFDSAEKEGKMNTQLMISQQMDIDCRDILLNNSVQAVDDMQHQRHTKAWQDVAEAIIVTAGTVGGWGDVYGRATAAHSVHDALTIFPETEKFLHGTKVSYGILVQLAFEHKDDELKELLELYPKLNLPRKLEDLGFDQVDDDLIHKIATEVVSPDKMIHFLPIHIDEKMIFDAMKRLEEIAKVTD